MADTSQAKYRVGGMDCASCASKIDTAVRRLPGVEDVSVSVTAGTMTVSHDGSSDLGAIEKRVTGLGYSVVPMPLGKQSAPAPSTHAHHDHDHAGHDHSHHDHDHAEID